MGKDTPSRASRLREHDRDEQLESQQRYQATGRRLNVSRKHDEDNTRWRGDGTSGESDNFRRRAFSTPSTPRRVLRSSQSATASARISQIQATASNPSRPDLYALMASAREQPLPETQAGLIETDEEIARRLAKHEEGAPQKGKKSKPKNRKTKRYKFQEVRPKPPITKIGTPPVDTTGNTTQQAGPETNTRQAQAPSASSGPGDLSHDQVTRQQLNPTIKTHSLHRLMRNDRSHHRSQPKLQPKPRSQTESRTDLVEAARPEHVWAWKLIEMGWGGKKNKTRRVSWVRGSRGMI